ncbi:hypothetical protein [Nocardiopsis ganjiahuensis]|uniref:hypothetical protein n=1 Tax=Nocardiopsis ganjiahuensis TaxID=239984 RepID=UPI00037FA496|nr:hypothetical protein [Nocardiopsis ganjiahuensis]
MNGHTAHPRTARRHPRALFGQMQIHAQNHPRAYAVRAVPVVFPPVLLPPPVFCVILLDNWSQTVPILLGAVVPVVVLGALMVLFVPWLTRRMPGASEHRASGAARLRGVRPRCLVP